MTRRLSAMLGVAVLAASCLVSLPARAALEGDFNKNSKLDPGDAVVLLRMALGLTPPIEMPVSAPPATDHPCLDIPALPSVDIPQTLDNSLQLGDGFSLERFNRMDQGAVDLDRTPPVITVPGGDRTTMDVNVGFGSSSSQDTSSSSLQFSMRAMFGHFTASSDVTKESMASSDKFSLSLTFNKWFATEKLKDAVLTTVSQKLLDQGEPAAKSFEARYGGYYVSEQHRAASLTITLSLADQSESQRMGSAFAASGGGTYGTTTVDAAATFTNAASSALSSSGGTIHVDAVGASIPSGLDTLVFDANSDGQAFRDQFKKLLDWAQGVVTMMDVSQSRIASVTLSPLATYRRCPEDLVSDPFALNVDPLTRLYRRFVILARQYAILDEQAHAADPGNFYDYLLPPDVAKAQVAREAVRLRLQAIRDFVVAAKASPQSQVDPSTVESLDKELVLDLPEPPQIALVDSGSNAWPTTNKNFWVKLAIGGGKFTSMGVSQVKTRELPGMAVPSGGLVGQDGFELITPYEFNLPPEKPNAPASSAFNLAPVHIGDLDTIDKVRDANPTNYDNPGSAAFDPANHHGLALMTVPYYGDFRYYGNQMVPVGYKFLFTVYNKSHQPVVTYVLYTSNAYPPG